MIIIYLTVAPHLVQRMRVRGKLRGVKGNKKLAAKNGCFSQCSKSLVAGTLARHSGTQKVIISLRQESIVGGKVVPPQQRVYTKSEHIYSIC